MATGPLHQLAEPHIEVRDRLAALATGQAVPARLNRFTVRTLRAGKVTMLMEERSLRIGQWHDEAARRAAQRNLKRDEFCTWLHASGFNPPERRFSHQTV